MSKSNELIDKLREFLSEEEIQEGIKKGVIKTDIEKGDQKTLERMPLTEYSSGIDSGTGPINQSTVAEPANWEMVKLTITKALEAFEKAQQAISGYCEKSEYAEAQDAEMEKACGKMESTQNEMKKVMKMYKAKNSVAKSEVDKAQFDEIEKAFNTKLTLLSTKNDQLEKANQALIANNDEMKKSLDALTDQMTKMQENMDKFGNAVPSPKAVNFKAYIEKGGVPDGDGKKIYHIDMHKGQIISALEGLRNNCDDLQKAQIDEDILNYSSANIAPSEAVSRLLYDKSEIKLVK